MDKLILVSISLEELEKIITQCVLKALEKDRENQNPRQLSLKQAAEMLNVSIPTMIKYKKDKIIQHKQLGRKIWFSINDIKSFLEKNSNYKYKRKSEVFIKPDESKEHSKTTPNRFKPKWKE